MDTDAKTAKTAEAGLPLRSSTLTEDRINKRKWVRDRLELLLKHAHYHKAHKEQLLLPGEVILKVGDEEGTYEIDLFVVVFEMMSH